MDLMTSTIYAILIAKHTPYFLQGLSSKITNAAVVDDAIKFVTDKSSSIEPELDVRNECIL
jgi:hypothetical protein